MTRCCRVRAHRTASPHHGLVQVRLEELQTLGGALALMQQLDISLDADDRRRLAGVVGRPENAGLPVWSSTVQAGAQSAAASGVADRERGRRVEWCVPVSAAIQRRWCEAWHMIRAYVSDCAAAGIEIPPLPHMAWIGGR